MYSRERKGAYFLVYNLDALICAGGFIGTPALRKSAEGSEDSRSDSEGRSEQGRSEDARSRTKKIVLCFVGVGRGWIPIGMREDLIMPAFWIRNKPHVFCLCCRGTKARSIENVNFVVKLDYE